MSKRKYYAVAAGRQTGIFTDWETAKELVQNFSGAKFKSFKSEDEARGFLEPKRHKSDIVEVITQEIEPVPKDVLQLPSTLVAFCDGSAINNGQKHCRAGYACIFPHKPEWNISKKLWGKPTNNRAEYSAALEAIKRANVYDEQQTEILYICTDSQLLINSMTKFIKKWRKNGWLLSTNLPVENQDLLKLLDREIGKRIVHWRFVKAHTGNQDWYSRWNDVADQEAKKAANS